MNTMIADVRSGYANDNLQELLDASASTGQALLAGQAQYSTPEWLARACARLLPVGYYGNVLDPQGASGQLVSAVKAGIHLIIELDNRFAKEVHAQPTSRITGNCVHVSELAHELWPDGLHFECIVANPPFGLRWKSANGNVDSTEWTWQFILSHLTHRGSGFLIANIDTLVKLGITTHPWVYLVQSFPAGGIWDNVNVKLGIVHFINASAAVCGPVVHHTWEHVPSGDEILRTLGEKHTFRNAAPYTHGTFDKFALLSRAVTDERTGRSKFNISLGKDGILRTYLSVVSSVKMKREDIHRLARINDCHPLSLVVEKETRDLLQQFITAGTYTIEPAAKQAIIDAIIDVGSQACPITPVTDFELVAYADEEDTLKCIASHPAFELTVGKSYPIKTGTYTFKDLFTRKKLHYSEEDDATEIEDHECELTGQDRYIEIFDDLNRRHRFMDRPAAEDKFCHPEAILWELFNRPTVGTVAETFRETFAANRTKLLTHAMLSGFTYFEGQLDYYARVGCKNYALVGADVGTGKTLGALSLITMRSPKRTLIIAPQGTMRSSGEEGEQDYQASQWVQEIRRFAPGEPVFQLFSIADYRAILHANGGEFPPGIYITYPQAYWQNGAFERVPDSWDPKEESKFRKFMSIPFPEDTSPDDYLHRGIGSASGGIRCIAIPSLATVLAEQPEWDMVIVDEAHLMANLDSQVTQNLIRLQPKYRYAMTATPIPNYVFNLFSLLGWLCVPGWYKGGVRNAAWPYAVNEVSRFSTTFMSSERDITEQQKARAAGAKNWSTKGIRRSPIISAPARLLKLLKPSMAYISKEACNDKLMPCEVIDVRVPMGSTQAKLYKKWLNRGEYVSEYKNPLTIALVQMQRLRGICASPATLDFNRGICKSDFNPKVIAILELIRDCLRRGEQVVVVCARVHQSDAIARRLSEAGISLARIDSTVSAEFHSAEANRFKKGDARVMLMGIKCAQGHSFDMCPNLIIGSLEWSYGSLHQAKGRVWRLTSKRPVKVWCVLHKGTFEELMFDRVAMKQDAATICLQGKRIARDFMPVDPSEVLAEHIMDYTGADDAQSELDCESLWPTLRGQLAR